MFRDRSKSQPIKKKMGRPRRNELSDMVRLSSVPKDVFVLFMIFKENTNARTVGDALHKLLKLAQRYMGQTFDDSEYDREANDINIDLNDVALVDIASNSHEEFQPDEEPGSPLSLTSDLALGSPLGSTTDTSSDSASELDNSDSALDDSASDDEQSTYTNDNQQPLTLESRGTDNVYNITLDSSCWRLDDDNTSDSEASVSPERKECPSNALTVALKEEDETCGTLSKKKEPNDTCPFAVQPGSSEIVNELTSEEDDFPSSSDGDEPDEGYWRDPKKKGVGRPDDPDFDPRGDTYSARILKKKVHYSSDDKLDTPDDSGGEDLDLDRSMLDCEKTIIENKPRGRGRPKKSAGSGRPKKRMGWTRPKKSTGHPKKSVDRSSIKEIKGTSPPEKSIGPDGPKKSKQKRGDGGSKPSGQCSDNESLIEECVPLKTGIHKDPHDIIQTVKKYTEKANERRDAQKTNGETSEDINIQSKSNLSGVDISQNDTKMKYTNSSEHNEILSRGSLDKTLLNDNGNVDVNRLNKSLCRKNAIFNSEPNCESNNRSADDDRDDGDDEPVLCLLCGDDFINAKELREHSKSKHSGVKDMCPYCMRWYPGTTRLWYHMKKCLEQQCSSCYKKFPSKVALLKHIESQHINLRFKCKKCEHRFETRVTADSHVWQSHFSRKRKIGDNFTKDSQWESDDETHSGNASKRQRKSSDKLNSRNLPIPKKDRRIKCPLCEHKSSEMRMLIYHIWRIHKVNKLPKTFKQYKCNFCGEESHCKTTLRRHLASHGDDRPYSCDLCNKSFQTKRNLKVHMKLHSADKNYMCNQCGLQFKRSSYLRQHERLHTGEVPYTCDKCGKGFAQKNSLNYHTNKHHTDSDNEKQT